VKNDPAVIVAARRTPIGAFQGALATVSAPRLSAVATAACLADTRLDPREINEVLLGCVLQAGVGQAPARQAALAAGIPSSVPTVTVNKVCGSGLKTIMLGCEQMAAGTVDAILAGGMESMSNAPYLLPKARAGYRMGHQEVLDHMFYDGLQNPYDKNMMGFFAEQTAKRYRFTREMQDAFAMESVRRAVEASRAGQFAAEIAAVTVTNRNGDIVVSEDEEPFRADIARIPRMKPAFASDGTVTAASSSSISDGAASVILMRESVADRHGLTPLARIVGFSSYAHEPEWFTTAPGHAMRALLKKLGWHSHDVDLYEINEAFACVTLAAMQELELDAERVNVHGGACALGHPIGATGARLLVTLIHSLRQRGGKRGVVALCIGGGEGLALAVEVGS
jgi:acetyl-CoA C-acetyltransferase